MKARTLNGAPDLITVPFAAKALGVRQAAIRAAIESGELTGAVRSLPGAITLLSTDALRLWIKTGRAA